MTEPSKAQIEAALEESELSDMICRMAASCRCVGDDNGADTDEAFCFNVARAVRRHVLSAITAAAEAKPKPTQSQIEAVKDTLRRLVILTGDSPWDWDDVARKVLAAAHEAWLSETFNERWQAAKDRAAAAEVSRHVRGRESPTTAEVGEQRQEGLAHIYAEGLRKGQIEMKERCAQAAENNIEARRCGESLAIAAAIRALKLTATAKSD